MSKFDTGPIKTTDTPPDKTKDIVFGAGGNINRDRVGSVYRDIVETHWMDYCNINNNSGTSDSVTTGNGMTKRDFIQINVVHYIQTQLGGRFLEWVQDRKTDNFVWRELDPSNPSEDRLIHFKVSQAFRDHKKKIMQKMGKHSSDFKDMMKNKSSIVSVANDDKKKSAAAAAAATNKKSPPARQPKPAAKKKRPPPKPRSSPKLRSPPKKKARKSPPKRTTSRGTARSKKTASQCTILSPNATTTTATENVVTSSQTKRRTTQRARASDPTPVSYNSQPKQNQSVPGMVEYRNFKNDSVDNNHAADDATAEIEDDHSTTPPPFDVPFTVPFNAEESDHPALANLSLTFVPSTAGNSSRIEQSDFLKAVHTKLREQMVPKTTPTAAHAFTRKQQHYYSTAEEFQLPMGRTSTDTTRANPTSEYMCSYQPGSHELSMLLYA